MSFRVELYENIDRGRDKRLKKGYAPDIPGLLQFFNDSDYRGESWLKDGDYFKVYNKKSRILRADKWELIMRFNVKMWLEDDY